MDNFDLRKYLAENKRTASEATPEEVDDVKGDYADRQLPDLITNKMRENLSDEEYKEFEKYRWLVKMIATEHAEEKIKPYTGWGSWS